MSKRVSICEAYLLLRTRTRMRADSKASRGTNHLAPACSLPLSKSTSARASGEKERCSYSQLQRR